VLVATGSFLGEGFDVRRSHGVHGVPIAFVEELSVRWPNLATLDGKLSLSLH